MKLRLKGEAFPKPLYIEFEYNNVTVLELKKRVSDLLELDQEETRYDAIFYVRWFFLPTNLFNF